MNIINNKNIKELNTFRLDVNATKYVQFHHAGELKNIFDIVGNDKFMILGGGSNVLFTGDFDGWILHNCIYGKDILSQTDDQVIVRFGAGETWHESVLWTLDNNYGGMENLSLIPGSVGAAPMQNIGAYGVEIKDIMTGLEAWHIGTQRLVRFSTEECDLGYRESIFKKTENRGKYIIISVSLRLTRKEHKINLQYGAIKETLDKMGVNNPGIRDISNAVIAIRKSKLPDPRILGNAGSFFKNPIITKNEFNKLIENYPAIPGYPMDNNLVKVPAGWLIEKCGFKGRVFGQTGSHKDQALVIVNYGNATGKEILEHANRIISEVKRVFGIELSPEVNIM